MTDDTRKLNVACACEPGTSTDVGGDATDGALLVSVTTTPSVGADPLKVMVP